MKRKKNRKNTGERTYKNNTKTVYFNDYSGNLPTFISNKLSWIPETMQHQSRNRANLLCFLERYREYNRYSGVMT